MTKTLFLFDQPITAMVTKLDEGVHVLLVGGDKSHIGAVSTAEPDGNIQTQRFPGHKDQYISVPCAEKMARTLGVRTTVVCGIHYDNASKSQIEEILRETEKMLAEMLAEGL